MRLFSNNYSPLFSFHVITAESTQAQFALPSSFVFVQVRTSESEFMELKGPLRCPFGDTRVTCSHQWWIHRFHKPLDFNRWAALQQDVCSRLKLPGLWRRVMPVSPLLSSLTESKKVRWHSLKISSAITTCQHGWSGSKQTWLAAPRKQNSDL